MNFTKTMFALAIGSVGIMGAMSAHASNVPGVLHTGDVLKITSGSTTGSKGFGDTGSFFGMDLSNNFKISLAEGNAITGLTGITIGSTTPDATTSTIDSWPFNGSFGSDYVKGTPVTGGAGIASLVMAGWTVAWDVNPTIPMGAAAWQSSTTNPTLNNVMRNLGQTYTSGMGNFVWDGVYGNAYTLDYTATVPTGAPFAGTKYYLHLEGTVAAAAVPEASTYGMMLAGLGLVGFAVRRRNTVA